MASFAELIAVALVQYGENAALEEMKMYREMHPWTEEPSGDDYGFMLRVSTEVEPNPSSSSGTVEVQSAGKFIWPENGYVLANATGIYWGLHGLLDGVGNWNHLPRFPDSVWQIVVVRRDECKPDPLGGAVRAPRGWVKYSGDPVGAMQLILPHMAKRIKEGEFDQLFPSRMHHVSIVKSTSKTGRVQLRYTGKI